MRWTPALVLFFALPLSADEPASASDEFFGRWDANQDGIVTKDECESSRLFAKMDRDANGEITKAEVEANWAEEEGTEPLKEPMTPGTQPGGGKRTDFPGAGKPGGKPGRGPGATGLAEDAERMRIRRIFNKFDRNGDGMLSPEETAAYYFELADYDRDGVLMEFELAANPKVGPDRAKMALEMYDKDADGTIVPSEFALPEDGQFGRMDTDGDGKISEAEAQVALRAPGGGGNTVAQPGEGQRGAMGGDRLIKQFDRDGDGKISADEFTGRPGLFEKGDTNADGFLDRAELDAAAKKMQQLGGGAAGKGMARDWASLAGKMDKDGDGKITAAEWQGKEQGFTRMDKDGNGVLEASDFGEAPAKAPAGGTDGGMEPQPENEGEGSGK